MKKIIMIIAVALFFTSLLTSCDPQIRDSKTEALNISIYLDLSDRLTRDLEPNQTYRDTAIINYIAEYFRSQTLGPEILKSENKMKIFFYPTPKSSEISILAQGLSVDVGEKKVLKSAKH